MLRGPEGSSQAADGGAPAEPHRCINMHGGQVFFSSGCCFAVAHTGGSRAPLEPALLHHTSTAAGVLFSCRSLPAASLPTAALFAFARGYHILPVSSGPRERSAELLVWGEVTAGACDVPIFLSNLCVVCVTVYSDSAITGKRDIPHKMTGGNRWRSFN